MYDKVIKAYISSVDKGLRIPYMEKKKEIGGLELIVSIYKNTEKDNFYCLAVVVDKGEYLFEEGREYSRFCGRDEVVGKDIAQETINIIKSQLNFRKRLLTFIGNNKHLPSILSVAFNSTLLVYYLKNNHLRISELKDGELIINLPPKEQVYLTELLSEFNIIVNRARKGLPGFGY